jgi:cytochrome c oxidase accessory protein FixG
MLGEDDPLIRLNIPLRKFHFLGSTFVPEEGFLLLSFLVVLGLCLFFFTALIGRVWCGWACPQTVYTDLFDLVGRKLIGKKYGKQDAPKYKIIILHLFWIVLGFIAAFHFIGYFENPYDMIKLEKGEYYPYALAFFTVAVYVDMAFIREQFCKYACPYARFQTVLMDEHSYNITYDIKRGEPRRKGKVKIGDCTACNMCLVVCPTGIDIREGLQVGCIACAKCVDACTVQMAKESKKSLINYDSLARVMENKKIKWIRPRTIVYGLLLIAATSTMSLLFANRLPLITNIQPDRSILPFETENHVRNIYKFNIHNVAPYSQNLKFEVEAPLTLMSGLDDGKFTLSAEERRDFRLILDIPGDTKKTSAILKIISTDSGKILIQRKIPISYPIKKENPNAN